MKRPLLIFTLLVVAFIATSLAPAPVAADNFCETQHTACNAVAEINFAICRVEHGFDYCHYYEVQEYRSCMNQVGCYVNH